LALLSSPCPFPSADLALLFTPLFFLFQAQIWLLSNPLFVLLQTQIWLFNPVLYFYFPSADLGLLSSPLIVLSKHRFGYYPNLYLSIFKHRFGSYSILYLSFSQHKLSSFISPLFVFSNPLFLFFQAQIWVFYPVLYLSFSMHRFWGVIITLAMEGRREPSLDRYMLLQECTAYLFDSSLTQCCHNRRFNFGIVLHKDQVLTLVFEPNSKNYLTKGLTITDQYYAQLNLNPCSALRIRVSQEILKPVLCLVWAVHLLVNKEVESTFFKQLR
jgi:hypothetical protein